MTSGKYISKVSVQMEATYSVVGEKSRQKASVVGPKNPGDGFPVIVVLLSNNKKRKDISFHLIFFLCFMFTT